jgi:hypothetical protein
VNEVLTYSTIYIHKIKEGLFVLLAEMHTIS